MQKNSGKKKEKCKNCEGKGLIKNGDKKMKCQRCGGTGFKSLGCCRLNRPAARSPSRAWPISRLRR